MKKSCLFVLLVLLCAALPLPVHAQDEAKYNFASAQGDKELKISPGAEGSGYIYFYNVDGNRITHISLEVKHAPPEWQVTIDPPLADTQVLVSGMPVTVTENLFVEPSALLDKEPESVPDGLVSINVPGRGYTLGKLARVVIKIPETAPLGSTGGITVAAEASWLGQSGTATLKQARDFDFNVTVFTSQKEYSEKVVGPDGTAAPDIVGAQPYESTSPPAKGSGRFSLNDWRWDIIIGACVIIVVLVVVLLVRRKR